jgi:hypothetical protein
MILIATWLKGQNYPNERPSLIYWADGTVTTHEDYVRDLDCTHTGIMNPDGSMQMIFLPDLSGAVSYDNVERVWKVRPQGETIQLDMEDPFADDHDITAEIYTCPIVYSAKINRARLTQTSH